MSSAQYTSVPSADLDGISGNIFVPNSEDNDNTLDEPVSMTLVSSVLLHFHLLKFNSLNKQHVKPYLCGPIVKRMTVVLVIN